MSRLYQGGEQTTTWPRFCWPRVAMSMMNEPDSEADFVGQVKIFGESADFQVSRGLQVTEASVERPVYNSSYSNCAASSPPDGTSIRGHPAIGRLLNGKSDKLGLAVPMAPVNCSPLAQSW
jgi:hypothetical protein